MDNNNRLTIITPFSALALISRFSLLLYLLFSSGNKTHHNLHHNWYHIQHHNWLKCYSSLLHDGISRSVSNNLWITSKWVLPYMPPSRSFRYSCSCSLMVRKGATISDCMRICLENDQFNHFRIKRDLFSYIDLTSQC